MDGGELLLIYSINSCLVTESQWCFRLFLSGERCEIVFCRVEARFLSKARHCYQSVVISNYVVTNTHVFRWDIKYCFSLTPFYHGAFITGNNWKEGLIVHIKGMIMLGKRLMVYLHDFQNNFTLRILIGRHNLKIENSWWDRTKHSWSKLFIFTELQRH